MSPLVLALAIAAAPSIELAPGLEPAAPLAREANAGWRDLAETWSAVTGTQPKPPRLRIERGVDLAPDRAGASRIGVIQLRSSHDGTLTTQMVVALRHELAHQLLWAACPAASDDALFHESFALSQSGELAAWNDGAYLSMGAAKRQLASSRSLDNRAARSALARLLANAPMDHGLPRVLAVRLRRCADGARWIPLTVDELAAIPLNEGDALVVLSRHSGEVLQLQGDANVPLPFGSTLKPFLAAAAFANAPVLPVDAKREEWSCGDDAPRTMDLPTALLRSCNGYFLDWAARDPDMPKLGAYGPILQKLGLSRLPADGSEAIGLRPTLKLTPLALAQAYRVLAASSPGVVDILRHNAERGTLSGLPASPRLRGVALKTGTVRDADSRAELGFIVAIDQDVVVVIARKGRQPRSFAGELADVLEPLRSQHELSHAEVQVLGLVPPEQVEARCPGISVLATKDDPRLAGAATQLEALTRDGEALCLGAPWMLSFPGGPKDGRPYAGSFRWSPPPAYVPVEGAPPPTERQRRAREGSSFIFGTRLGLYVAGVLAAEDSQLAGEPRAALARAVAHNAAASRHPGRPLCDTTHCQAFRGTLRPEPGDAAALNDDALSSAGWLTFSQGGDEPWSEVRALPKVAQALGATPLTLGFSSERVHFTVRSAEGDAVFEDRAELPCERLRNPLHLPACPDAAELVGSEVRFHGHGRGHGEGLDLEAAKRGPLDHRALLQSAYGADR
ncbi:MAG: hypothetical protein JST54_09795 [Deltaproteobacteria bacterium]|nr:hypothetical protein [Deltaproteobacteria bacterium]